MLALAVLVISVYPCQGFLGENVSVSQITSVASGSPESCSASNKTGVCPFGFYCYKTTCNCRKAPDKIIQCNDDTLYNFALLSCFCATFDRRVNLLQVGTCVWNCGSASHSLNISDAYGMYHHFKNYTEDHNMCQPLKRTGTLCGRCLPHHYPLAYSYSFACTKCRHTHWNWARYIMAAYLPLTLFALLLLFCKINIVSSNLTPVVYYSQGMSIPPLARIMLLSMSYRPIYLTSVKVLLSLYGVWNLDFFRPFYNDLCLGIGILPTLALDYATAVYPLLLMMISYLLIVLHDRNYRVIIILWRPCQVLFSHFRRNWDIRTSVIDVFSTLFLLSNVKLLTVSFDLLAPTRVYHLYGDTYNYTLGLYYSADIEYFGKEHLPYGILANVMVCVFVILPVAILAIYPFAFFQKFLNLFPVRWYILHTFVDSFQGCYKDGTEPGTRDCRWFSALYLVLRFVPFLLYGITQSSVYFLMSSIFFLFGIFLLVAFQPYKNRVASHFQTHTIFLILYVMFYAAVKAIGQSDMEVIPGYMITFLFFITYVLAFVPFFCILGFMLHWVFSRCRFCLQLVRRLRWWCRGYVAMGGDDDADTYCDRVVNPQAYPTAGQMVNCSS